MPYASRIPKYGTFVKMWGKAVGNVEKVLGQLRKGIERLPLDELRRVLGPMSKTLGAVQKSAKATKVSASVTYKALSAWMKCSDNKSTCPYRKTVEGWAKSYPVNTALISYYYCAKSLDMSVPRISLPKFPDLGILDKLASMIGKWVDFLKSMVGEVSEKANYALCCDNFLRVFNTVFTGVSRLVGLGTCFIEGAVDGHIKEVLDVYMNGLDELFGDVNSVISDVNKFVATLNSKKFSYVQPQTNPKFSFSKSSCKPASLGRPSNQPRIDFNIPKLSTLGGGISFDTDGSYSLNAVGGKIANACKDAFNAMSDSMDCCDLARTCAVEDKILLYEGDRCTQNIAGTLGATPQTVRAFDKTCLANDEARSLKLIGPLNAGLLIELGDNPNNLCSDDYASILLTKPLPPGEELCINSFVKTETGSNYKTFYRANNGIQGKVSRFQITTHTNVHAVNMNRCDKPSTMTFFEGNNCKQDVVLTRNLPVPNYGKHINDAEFKRVFRETDTKLELKSITHANDEIRSVRITGPYNPLPGALWVHMHDSPSCSSRDDWSAVVLFTTLKAGESICISSFERQFKTYTRPPSLWYQLKFLGQHNHRRNGLDGKVSCIRYHVDYSERKWT